MTTEYTYCNSVGLGKTSCSRTYKRGTEETLLESTNLFGSETKIHFTWLCVCIDLPTDKYKELNR